MCACSHSHVGIKQKENCQLQWILLFFRRGDERTALCECLGQKCVYTEIWQILTFFVAQAMLGLGLGTEPLVKLKHDDGCCGLKDG